MNEDHALTPVAAERRLLHLDNELTKAELDLRRIRDAEVDAQHVYEAALRRAGFDKDCPRVARNGATVDERKQWIDDRCAAEQRAYDVAVSARKGAETHLKTVDKQSMIALGLLKSVTTAYNMSGATP